MFFLTVCAFLLSFWGFVLCPIGKCETEVALLSLVGSLSVVSGEEMFIVGVSILSEVSLVNLYFIYYYYFLWVRSQTFGK